MVVVSEMTYTVSSGTLNSTIPYHTGSVAVAGYVCVCVSVQSVAQIMTYYSVESTM